MQWMADGIHDFTVADRQKNPLEELIILWIIVIGGVKGCKLIWMAEFISTSLSLLYIHTYIHTYIHAYIHKLYLCTVPSHIK